MTETAGSKPACRPPSGKTYTEHSRTANGGRWSNEAGRTYLNTITIPTKLTLAAVCLTIITNHKYNRNIYARQSDIMPGFDLRRI